jgi:hypothetical protein
MMTTALGAHHHGAGKGITDGDEGASLLGQGRGDDQEGLGEP